MDINSKILAQQGGSLASHESIEFRIPTQDPDYKGLKAANRRRFFLERDYVLLAHPRQLPFLFGLIPPGHSIPAEPGGIAGKTFRIFKLPIWADLPPAQTTLILISWRL
jgi:hypothetical protein